MPAAIRIADDHMTAWLDIPANEKENVEQLRALISAANIRHGLQREALFAATRPAAEDRSLVIALGTAPVDGKPGESEVLVDVREGPPKDPSGVSDFHQLHLFCDVTRGQALVRALPADPGIAGQSVLGEPVWGKPGTLAELKTFQGDGTALETDRLVAAFDGVCRRSRRGENMVLTVTPKLEIAADVDNSIGDIDTAFDVEIKGDIKLGFSVKTGGSLTVKGIIEDARVSAKGNLVASGIVAGQNRVKSRSDITIKHANGREIKCRNLHVAGGLIECTVLAIGHVHAHDIIGGRVVAAGSVTADVIGDQWAAPTLVQVGVNPYEKSLFDTAGREREHALRSLDDIEQHLQVLSSHLAGKRGNQAETMEEVKRLVVQREAFRRLLTTCDQVITHQNQNLDAAKVLVNAARINVGKMVYNGVTLLFGESARMQVTDPFGKTSLYAKDGVVAL